MKHDYVHEQASDYWVINIEIPDNELVEELANHCNSRLEKAIISSKTTEEHRGFLRRDLHIARSKDEVRQIFSDARAARNERCVVIALNASLSQKEYHQYGVISFKYLSWTKEAWNLIMKASRNPIVRHLVKRLVNCLLDDLIRLGCEALKSIYF